MEIERIISGSVWIDSTQYNFDGALITLEQRDETGELMSSEPVKVYIPANARESVLVNLNGYWTDTEIESREFTDDIMISYLQEADASQDNIPALVDTANDILREVDNLY